MRLRGGTFYFCKNVVWGQTLFLVLIPNSSFLIRHSCLECFPKRDLLRPNVTPGPKRFVALGVRTSRQSRDWPRVRPLRAPNLFETVRPASESKESALARRFLLSARSQRRLRVLPPS